MFKALVVVLLLSVSSLAQAGCLLDIYGLQQRRSRGRQMETLMQNHDIRGLKKFFWEAHDQDVYEGGQRDKPFYRMLRYFNGSHHVPNLFQTKNKITGSEIDTFSTVFNAADDSLEYSHLEREAIDDILLWLADAQNYRKKINAQIELGMEKRQQYIELKAKLSEFKQMKFPRKVSMPVIIDGKVKESYIEFELYEDLRDYIKDSLHKSKLIFSQNYIDDIAQNSKIYKTQIDYAVQYRRVELAHQRLSRVPVDHLSNDQDTLRIMLKEFLNSEAFRPRKYAYKRVRRKEFWNEFWAALKLWKSKRIVNDAKYPFPIELAKISPVGIFLKLSIFTAVGTAAMTPVAIIYEDNPWVQYLTSYISNFYHDTLVLKFGWPTNALADCYKSERPWTTEEGSAMNNFVESHLSQYTAYTRIDPSYNPERDEPDNFYIRRKLELQALCAKKRLEYKKARRHVENKELLSTHGYIFAAHMALIELIQAEEEEKTKDSDKAKNLAKLLYEYFEFSEVLEDEAKAGLLLSQIEKIRGQKFVDQIKQYQADIPKAMEAIRRGDFNLYAPSTDAYFEKLKLYED